MKTEKAKISEIKEDSQLSSLLKQQKRTTRIKERMIEDAVVLVLKWRQLANVRNLVKTLVYPQARSWDHRRS